MKTRTVPLVTYHKHALERIAMLHAHGSGAMNPDSLPAVQWNWDAKGLDNAADIALTVTMEVEVPEGD